MGKQLNIRDSAGLVNLSVEGIPGFNHGCDRLQILDRTEAEESINATQKGCRVNAMDNRPRDMLSGARGNRVVEAYCFKRKARREIKNAEQVLLKNKRPAIKESCPVCGGKIFRFGKEVALPPGTGPPDGDLRRRRDM